MKITFGYSLWWGIEFGFMISYFPYIGRIVIHFLFFYVWIDLNRRIK